MTGRHKLYADLLQEYSKDDFKPQLVRKIKKSDWIDYQHYIYKNYINNNFND